ncbi:bifunctional nuclease domain-containing protein [candidate division KSB1 bacterium]
MSFDGIVSVRVHGVTADPTTNQFLMLLVDDIGKRLLPIVIGQWEAQSIAWNMQGVEMQRPLTHDLFKSVLSSTELSVKKIIINDLKENTFYAKISVLNKKEEIEIDSRPSDAVAIALRMNAPIYVLEDVIEKAAVKIEDESQFQVSEITLLDEQMKKAIDNEDYENAAIIRDKIRELRDRENKPKDDKGTN